MATYPVVDLTTDTAEIAVTSRGSVDLDELRDQLVEIRDTLSGLIDADSPDGIRLSSVELSLTVGAEGGVWFIAKGSVEGSITMTFSGPD